MSYPQTSSQSPHPVQSIEKAPPHWLPRFFGEAFLVLSFVAMVYVGLALLSYSKLDPGFSTTSQVQEVQNTVGLAGAWLADTLFWVFGKSVWLLWLAFLVYILQAANKWLRIIGLGDFLVDRRVDYPLWLRWVGLTLLMLSATALEWSRGYHWQASLPDHPGGALGSWLGQLTTTYLGFFASALFLVPLFCFGLSWAFGFSWLRFARWIGQKIEFLYLEFNRKREFEEDARIGQEALKERDKEVRETSHLETESGESRADDEVAEAALAAEHLNRPPLRTQAKLVPAQVPETVEPSSKVQQHTLFQDSSAMRLPQIALLDPVKAQEQTVTPETLEMTSRLIEKRLKDFGVVVKVVLASPGPVVTRYEIEPATGVKGSQIVNLAKDLARSLSLVSIRVIETIPGKNYMALELPNAKRQTISLAEILGSKVYDEAKSLLTIGLGKDIVGKPVVADLAKMPHCLVAGTTGSGKSVGINAMILSLLYKADARDVRLLLIDPKMLEMSVYEGIPHLLAPVVTDMRQAAHGLNWCVAEMEKRYKLMSKLGVRNLAGYNQKIDEAAMRGQHVPNPFSLTPEEPEPLERLPHIVVVIDELADLMMVVGKKIEELIARLAQKARAAGIHLILATQRPSVDVITGLIKANIPTRISFQVSSKIDSRTILDQMGAEALLGMGDMLYMPSGTGLPIRVHGAFVSDEEVHRVVDYLKEQGGEPNYIDGVLEGGVSEEGLGAGLAGLGALGLEGAGGEKDPLYDQAVEIVVKNRKASISLVQRHLKIGYNRAARLLEDMENAGLVSSMSGSGQREILVPQRGTEAQD